MHIGTIYYSPLSALTLINAHVFSFGRIRFSFDLSFACVCSAAAFFSLFLFGSFSLPCVGLLYQVFAVVISIVVCDLI